MMYYSMVKRLFFDMLQEQAYLLAGHCQPCSDPTFTAFIADACMPTLHLALFLIANVLLVTLHFVIALR